MDPFYLNINFLCKKKLVFTLNIFSVMRKVGTILGPKVVCGKD